MSETYPITPPPEPPPPVTWPDTPPDPPFGEAATVLDVSPPPVLMLFGDEILRDHERAVPSDQQPNISPLAAPPLLGSGYTVTVANPTPPTNVADVACGTPPHFTATYTGVWHKANSLVSDQVTFTDDLALFAGAGAAGSLTAIATPTAGGSGPVSEATGTVVVVTAPGSRAECPTQSVSVQGSYTFTPNASHASAQAPVTLPTITTLTPSAPVGNGGTTDLVVAGTGFRPDSVVMVAGIQQITQFVSATSLHVLNAPKRSSAGTSAIQVMTGGVQTATSTWTFS
jgi:hypothetical protein